MTGTLPLATDSLTYEGVANRITRKLSCRLLLQVTAFYKVSIDQFLDRPKGLPLCAVFRYVELHLEFEFFSNSP